MEHLCSTLIRISTDQSSTNKKPGLFRDRVVGKIWYCYLIPLTTLPAYLLLTNQKLTLHYNDTPDLGLRPFQSKGYRSFRLAYLVVFQVGGAFDSPIFTRV